MIWYAILIKCLYALEWISLIFALRALFVYHKRGAIIFSLTTILLLTVIVESFGLVQMAMYDDLTGINNQWAYNLYRIISFSLWYFIYYKLLKGHEKKVILLFICFLIAILIESFWYIDYKTQAIVYPHILAGLSLSFFILLYFVDLLQGNKRVNLLDDMFFWISIGLLFFYVVYIPFAAIQNYYTDIPTFYSKIFYTSHMVFSCLMYIMFSIGINKYVRVK